MFGFLDFHDVGDAPIEERPGVFVACTFVVEPVEKGGGIDACQQEALGIEIEIGGVVASRIPHAIHGRV